VKRNQHSRKPAEKRKSSAIPHLEKRGAAHRVIVTGKPFLILGGQVHNSSSSNLEYMKKVWDKLIELHCNTALAPVSWELVEPRKGAYDFSLVTGLISEARKRGLRLVLLWFATFKNTHSTYVPEWVKTDLERFPRAQLDKREYGEAITCFSDEARAADCRAFAALMRHVKKLDGVKNTVIMVQVQNETGLLGASRDHCPLAETAFRGNVPDALLSCLKSHEADLRPELLDLWKSAGGKDSGTWSDVFGSGADEVFMAWHIAAYVQSVAHAGRREYPLPMYANAWLVQHPGQAPGLYPSGGPVSRMMDVWHCAAPDIATLSPDIYVPWFAEACRDYSRNDNPLFIPEAAREAGIGAKCIYAFGRHDAIGFSPFGIDSFGSPAPVFVEGPVADGPVKCSAHGAAAALAGVYRVFGNMSDRLLEYQGTGRMTAVLQDKEQCETLEFGGYRFSIEFASLMKEGAISGAALLMHAADNEFIIVGTRCQIPHPWNLKGQRITEFISIDEGCYQNSRWIPGRRLNGDERGLRFGDAPSVLRIKLYSYD
jgi:hypothetical protein